MRRHRDWLVSALAGAMAAGCATTAEPASQATPISPTAQLRYRDAAPGTAPVTVVRDRSQAGAACPTNVYVGEDVAARVGSGQVATLHIPAGVVILGVQPDGLCPGGLVERQVTLAAGRPLTVRLGPPPSGGSIVILSAAAP